jgi:hypothetical protein
MDGEHVVAAFADPRPELIAAALSQIMTSFRP